MSEKMEEEFGRDSKINYKQNCTVYFTVLVIQSTKLVVQGSRYCEAGAAEEMF